MKNYLLLLVALLVAGQGYAQKVIIDREHFSVVLQNGAIRSAAENTHAQYLGRVNDNIDNLNANMGTVVLAQNMIYEGLSNVNSALKNGLAVRNMAVLVADMYSYTDKMLVLAKDEPYLLIFAGNMTAQMRSRATALLTDVSSFILKEDGNLLADYNSRDELLRKVTQHLQIINGLAYGAWKSIFWAKQRGLVASLTPFAGYLNQDKMLVERILQQAQYLKP